MRKTITALLILSFIVFSATCFAAVQKININTANAVQLTQLDRVGQTYANRIVEYRKKNGAFKKTEDIMKVKGIGPKTFEANKDKIVVREKTKQTKK